MNGLSSQIETLADGASHRAASEDGGADNSGFAVLLSLIVAAPVQNGLPDIASGEDSASSEGSRAAGVQGINEALINPPAGEMRSLQNSASEMPPQSSADSIPASETQVYQSVPQPAPSSTAEVLLAREAGGDDDSVSSSASRDQWSWAKEPLAAPYSFDASAVINAQGASAAAPKESLHMNAAVTQRITSLPRAGNSDEAAYAHRQAGTKQQSGILEGELMASDPPKLRGDPVMSNKALNSAVPSNANNNTALFQPLFKDQLTRGSIITDNPSALEIQDGDTLHQLVSPTGAEHAQLAETELKSVARLPADGELNSRVTARSSEIVSESFFPGVQDGKQQFSYLQDDGTLPGESSLMNGEPNVESIGRDAALFQLAHTAETVPAAGERESRRVVWRPVIDRVFDEISGRIHVGKQQAVLQLDPPELGKMRIDIHVEGDKLAARILAETQDARALIEAHLPDLRQALVENRIELVDIRIDSGSWSQWGDGQQMQQESGPWRQTAPVASDLKPAHSEKREPSRPRSPALEPGRVSMWA